MRHRVAVIGCGTAGPAAALNIARRLSWKVDLYDRTAEPSAVGAGIGLQPIGMTAASNLGIYGGILRHGARVESIQTHSSRHDGGGQPVLDVAYSRYDERLFGLGLHRGVLFELLLEACLAEPNLIETRFGHEISEIEQHQSGSGGGSSSGSGGSGGAVTLRDTAGNSHGPYDLVIMADGTNSRLRASLGIPHHFQRYAYGALFALLPDDGRTFGTALRQVHSGPGCHRTLGFLPTGYAWGDEGGTFRTTLYFNMRHDELPKWKADGLDRWRDECAKMMPEAEPLLASIASTEQLAFASYSDGTMWRFHHGRVVCIGDASHSMSPQLGQGANLAMIDAEKLVDALVASSRVAGEGGAWNPAEERGTIEAGVAGETCDIDAALAAYTAQRWLRVVFYQAQSRLLTPLFASRSEVLRTLRDAFAYTGCHTPGLQRFVHAVLCGAQSPNLVGTIPKREYLGFLDELERLGVRSEDAGVR